ncbi:MAG: hypothetical protein RLZZ292_387 [Bacteroidota bacterium]|jgi:hypothetical protein
MNKSDFNQTGGYPLKTERLQEMQTAYSIFNSLGALAGNLTIISGCTVTGTIVGDGYIYINGELLEFKEADGAGAPTVIIIETPVDRSFKNGAIKQVHTLRYATFGTAVDFWPWSDFKRLDPIISMMARLNELEKKSAVFQAGGGMLFWNKPLADIPDGWQEVVDWRGRIPVGLDKNDPDFNIMGKMEGRKELIINANNIPKFTLNYTMPVRYNNTDDSPGGGTPYFKPGTGTLEFGTDNPDAINILNPYRVVLFIEYIG